MDKHSRYHQNKAQLQEEQKWVSAAKQNNKAFEPLYKKYHEPIFRFVYQRMDDKDKAFDITAQVFVKAMTNIKKYQFKGVPFSAWLFRIAQNELYQSFKDKKAERTVNVETEHLHQMAAEIDDKEDLVFLTKQITNELKTLPENDLQMIELRYFENRPFKEIADILDMTENNAKVKCFRALQKLKKQLSAVKN